jgi:hypothetical protein
MLQEQMVTASERRSREIAQEIARAAAAETESHGAPPSTPLLPLSAPLATGP